jgi:nucleoid-associated protein YgaU
MGILSSIKDKLLGKNSGTSAASTTTTKAPSTTGAGAAAAAAAMAAGKAAAAKEAAAKAAKASAAAPVDIEAVIEQLVKAKGVKSNWRVSIVDLLSALDIDSSFAARKVLADELKYKGAYSGTAEQNIWLHSEVMRMLSANGGKVPKELLK